MTRARKFFPRHRITDFLFRRVRRSKLKRNLVYVLFREDEYISKHFDLCEKMLRYVLDWVSEVRQPYRFYTLPNKRFMMPYFLQIKKVIEAEIPDELSVFDNMTDIMEINREAIRRKDKESSMHILDILRRKNKRIESLVHLGDNIFFLISSLVDYVGIHNVTYLVQLYMYYSMQLDYDHRLELVREGVEPNPGPKCYTCDRVYLNDMWTLCPLCAPDWYLARTLLKDKKEKKNLIQ